MPSTRNIVTYRPDADEERLLAALAKKTGLNKSRLIGLALRQMADRERVENQVVALTIEERARLDALNEELPRPFWQRYTALADHSRIGVLNASEQAEFLEMIQKSEAWNVRRLEMLEQFAQQRGMHFPELMQALEIRHHPYA